jgi:hypothetical protein
VSFAAIIFCVDSQRVFIVVYFVMDSYGYTLEAPKLPNSTLCFNLYLLLKFATYSYVACSLGVLQFSVIREAVLSDKHRWIFVLLSYPDEKLTKTPWNHLEVAQTGMTMYLIK